VETIIRLRGRLQNRLKQNAEVVGSDESFFENQTSDDDLAALVTTLRRPSSP